MADLSTKQGPAADSDPDVPTADTGATTAKAGTEDASSAATDGPTTESAETAPADTAPAEPEPAATDSEPDAADSATKVGDQADQAGDQAGDATADPTAESVADPDAADDAEPAAVKADTAETHEVPAAKADAEHTEDDALPTEVIAAPRRKRSRPGKVVVTLSLVLALLVATGAALFVHNDRITSADADRTLALQTAQSVATNLTTISAENASGQIDALNKQATGAFKDQIGQYSAMFQAVLKQGGVASSSEITAAGVEKLDGDNATALVTVAAQISSAQVPTGQQRPYRLAIQMQRDGDHWLASNVEFLP